MKLCIKHEVIVETTGGYVSSINLKLEPPHQTIDNMVDIQLLSCGKCDDLWCLCYQYIICLIYLLINRRLDTAPIFAWHKHKNISYTIIFTDLVIWE